MKRRDFFRNSLTAGAVAMTATTLGVSTEKLAQGAGSGKRRQYIEFRTYTVADQAKKEKLIEVLDEGLIPALNRQNIKPVGVFWTNQQINGNDDFDRNVFVLIPHNSTESFLQCNEKLLADKVFVQAAQPILKAEMKNPLYTELKSTLMLGFEECPSVEVPTLAMDRVLQIRFYKSYNFERNAAKIHMFEQGGELALFRSKKMLPVFFGDTIFGDFMPNLTYMLSFENDAQRKEAWKAFVESPQWAGMKDLPEYKDTANTITNIFLKPSPKSQV